MPHDTTEEAEETGVSAVAAALLTAAQAAQILGISTRRLRGWRKEGRIAEAGRFKRGTARVPLFDPGEVMRAKAVQAAEETPEASATAVAPAMGAAAFAEAVARQVGLLLAERSAAEAATVAPLVALVREQQETIDELRRRAAIAEAERDRLTVAQAPPAVPGAPEALTPDDPSGAPSAGFWARVRRVFGGGLTIW